MCRKLTTLKISVKEWYQKQGKRDISLLTGLTTMSLLAIPASAEGETFSLASGLSDVKTLVSYTVEFITGNWYLGLFVVLSLVGYSFSVFKKAKRAVK